MSRFHKLEYGEVRATVDLDAVLHVCIKDKPSLFIRFHGENNSLDLSGSKEHVDLAYHSLSDALVGYHHISLEGVKG